MNCVFHKTGLRNLPNMLISTSGCGTTKMWPDLQKGTFSHTKFDPFFWNLPNIVICYGVLFACMSNVWNRYLFANQVTNDVYNSCYYWSNGMSQYIELSGYFKTLSTFAVIPYFNFTIHHFTQNYFNIEMTFKHLTAVFFVCCILCSWVKL